MKVHGASEVGPGFLFSKDVARDLFFVLKSFLKAVVSGLIRSPCKGQFPGEA